MNKYLHGDIRHYTIKIASKIINRDVIGISEYHDYFTFMFNGGIQNMNQWEFLSLCEVLIRWNGYSLEIKTYPGYKVQVKLFDKDDELKFTHASHHTEESVYFAACWLVEQPDIRPIRQD